MVRLQELRKDEAFRGFRSHIDSLQSKYKLDLVNIFQLLSEKEIIIPACIFSRKTSALEAVSKYMHENLNLSFNRIAELLNRSSKTVWQAYRAGKTKHSPRYRLESNKHFIPVSVLSDRRLSMLESISIYLKDHYGLRYSEIAEIVHRDQRTIWTVCARARKKRG